MKHSARLQRLEERRSGRAWRGFQIWLPVDDAGRRFWCDVGGVRVEKTATELDALGAIEIGGEGTAQ